MTLDSRILGLVGDIQGLLDLDEFREGLIVALRRAIRSDWVSLNDIGPGEGDVWSLVVPAMSRRQVEIFSAMAHQNPLVQFYQHTHDARAYRISDVSRPEEFHATELYQRFYKPIGMRHQIAFTLPRPPTRVLGVALSRKRGDFTEEERELLNRARPFLIQGYRNALDYSAVSQAAADPDSGRVVEGLRAAGLTPREATVMRLVALGRSNGDAAAELGLSARTVQKHVEHAFRKLGVHTRSQAAARAWELGA